MIAAPVRPPRAPSRRAARYLLACSALAATVGGTGAWGQSIGAFNGAGNVVSGTVTIGPNGSNNIVVDSLTAIINWSASGSPNGSTGAVEFGAAGSTATFTTTAQRDYTVLNRVFTESGSPIQFSGRVESLVRDGGGAMVRGGQVWFYSPDGIILGANSSFNVGSLILTTNEVRTTIDSQTGEEVLPTIQGGVRFEADAASRAQIVVIPGAQVTAPQPGSYVAMIAPRINQQGNVDVNGSTGYLALSAADVKINAGLFTISNTIGSQAETGEAILRHSGTTTGNAQTSTAQPHVIYMTAISENEAVSMLVSGNVGYRAASTAGTVNGTVVLGGGYAFEGGGDGVDLNIFTPADFGVGKFDPPVSVSIPDGRFNSPVFVRDTGDFALTTASGSGTIALSGLTVYSDHGATLSITNAEGGPSHVSGIGNIDLESNDTVPGTAVTATIDAGNTLDLVGKLSLSEQSANGTVASLTVRGTATLGDLAVATSIIANSGTSAAAGTSSILIDGGTLNVFGDIYLGALASGPNLSGVQFDSRGGIASLTVQNSGTANLGTLRMNVSADDPTGAAPGVGGVQRGGSATISATSGGTIDIGGALSVDTHATGLTGTSPFVQGSAVATVTGGSIEITADGGTIRQTGTGAAGAVLLDAGATGGNAQGGRVRLEGSGGGTLSIAGDTTMNAFGRGGGADGDGQGATGFGGTIDLVANGGTMAMAGAVTAYADGRGADAAIGGRAGGGAVTLLADNAGTLQVGSGMTAASFDASATGGTGGATTGDGAAQGGVIDLTVNRNASATASKLMLMTSATSRGSATPGAARIASLADAPAGGGGATAPAVPLTLESLSIDSFGNRTTDETTVVVDSKKPIAITGGAMIAGISAVSFTASGASSLTIGGKLIAVGSTIRSTHDGGAPGFETITAGNAEFTADQIDIAGLASNGDFTATATNGGAITLGSVRAAKAVTVSGGAVTIGSDSAQLGLDGTTIAISGTDIVIASGGRVGNDGTTNVTLANAGSGTSYVGNDSGAPTGAWTLDSSELGRVFGGTVTIGAAASGGDMVIGNLTLFGPNIDGTGNVFGSTLSFLTPGTITLLGRLALIAAAPESGIKMNAGGAIRGVLPNAAIVVTDSAGDGDGVGTISLTADRILFATTDAASVIDSGAPLATIDARLAMNDGNIVPAGYLRAGGVGFMVGSGLYTQNSGESAAIADRAGVTAGSNGITVASTNGRRIGVVLNGRLTSPEATGAALVAPVRSRSGGNAVPFARGSTINGCPADGTGCGGTPPGGGTNPGNGGTTPPGGGTDPGNGGTTPPGGGTDPGNGGTTPPGGGTDPGNGGTTPPGGGTDPGNGGTTPPGGGTDPGNGGTTPPGGGTDPGNGGTTPPGGGTTPPTGGTTPPSQSPTFGESANAMIQPVQDVIQLVTAPSGLGNAAAFSFDRPALITRVDIDPVVNAPLIDVPVTGAGNEDYWSGVGVGRELGPTGTVKVDGASPK